MSDPIEFNAEIPTTFTRERIGETLVKYSNWFYEFRFSSGYVPTLDALYSMIFTAGFDRAYLCVPPPEMHRQYPSFDRVVVVAQVLR